MREVMVNTLKNPREIIGVAEYGRRHGWSQPYVSRLLSDPCKLGPAAVPTRRGRLLVNKVDRELADRLLAELGISMTPASDFAKDEASRANKARAARNKARRDEYMAAFYAKEARKLARKGNP